MSSNTEAPATTELTGSVERVTFYNPENGFSVPCLRVRRRREPITVVGTLPSAQPGERLILEGHWQTRSSPWCSVPPGSGRGAAAC